MCVCVCVRACVCACVCVCSLLCDIYRYNSQYPFYVLWYLWIRFLVSVLFMRSLPFMRSPHRGRDSRPPHLNCIQACYLQNACVPCLFLAVPWVGMRSVMGDCGTSWTYHIVFSSMITMHKNSIYILTGQIHTTRL